MLKKWMLAILALSISFFLFTACGDDDSTGPDPVDEFALVAAAGDTYLANYTTNGGLGVNISATALFDNLTDGNTANDPFIIDWRSSADYATKHIKGAVNLAIGDLVAKVEDGTIPTDKTIVNVCYTGQNASVATSVLNLLGYEAQNMLYGMCGVDTSIVKATNWYNQIKGADERTLVTDAATATETHDFPTIDTGEKTAEAIIKAQFSNITAGWTVSADAVWDNPSNYFIVNYWGATDYANPGHIPGAIQFTPKTSLLSTSTLNLLPTDKTIVIYCYTGQTSAQVTAYLRLLGYDAKSLLYGVNGFAYNAMAAIGHQYAVPTGDFSAILE